MRALPGAWRRRARAVLLASAACLPVLGALVFAVPLVETQRATEEARRCLARFRIPRGPEPPDCFGIVQRFVEPSRVSWTAHAATYRAEELIARAAHENYVDAAVGRPDAAALAARAAPLASAEKRVREGSRRLVLDELGLAIGAPDLGKTAASLGDARTLLGLEPGALAWHVRLAALQAAWLHEGEGAATALARRYAEWDPRDEDLRAAVGATLCLGGEAARGVEMLRLVQDERARRRHAAMARDWGAERAALVACARGAGLAPPEKPFAEAGRADAEAARAALWLEARTGTGERAPGAEGGEEEDDDGSAGAPPGAALASALAQLRRPLGRDRPALLAAVLGAVPSLGDAEIEDLSGRREGEWLDPRLLATATASDWLSPPPPPGGRPESAATLEPDVRPATYVEAARRLEKLGPGRPAGGVAPGDLRRAAARLFALAGALDEALAALGEPGGTPLEAAATALARSNAAYLAGARERALAELEGALSAPGSAAAGAPRVAILVQRAELLASLGRREAMDAALEADRAAAALGDPVLDARAQWTRLALVDPKRAPALRGSARLPEKPGPSFWPWVGFAERTGAWTTGEPWRRARIGEALARFAQGLTAGDPEQRAFRYAMLSARGDAPPWLTLHLTLAARLVPEGGGDRETWLDAFAALEKGRFPLHALAFARAEAARLYGDAAAAAAWWSRYESLAAARTRPRSAILAQYLGL